MLESIYAPTKKKPPAIGAPIGAPIGGSSALKAFLTQPVAQQPIASNPAALKSVTQPHMMAAGAPDSPAAPAPTSSVDYSSDPVLAQMLAGGAADEADADQSALTARRGVVSQLGDRNLASQVLGAGDPTLDSISDNPDTSTSTLARLKRAYGSTVKTNEDQLNTDNLWYGGEHGRVLGNLSKDYQTQTADASSQAQAALAEIAASLASTKAGIRDKRQSAESAAADRKAQQLLAEIMAGGGGDGGDGGGGSKDPGGGGAPADTAASGEFWDPVRRTWVGGAPRDGRRVAQ